MSVGSQDLNYELFRGSGDMVERGGGLSHNFQKTFDITCFFVILFLTTNIFSEIRALEGPRHLGPPRAAPGIIVVLTIVKNTLIVELIYILM